jgi:transcriptional regulator with XRE-family HTH domain
MALTIGQQIKRYREKKGLTQAELAYIIGVDHSNISQIENDKREINLTKLRKICEALDVMIAQILE